MTLEKIFTAGLKGKNFIEHRRIILTTTFLIIATFVFTLFAFVNLFQVENRFVALLDAIAALSTLFALINLYRNHAVDIGAIIGSISLLLFFIAFVYINGNTSFGIIWTIFFPIFVITLLGRKLGLELTAFYYAILFYLAYNGIDVWQDGMWDLTSFLRYCVASLVITYIIYMHELSLEKAQEELDAIRQKEIVYTNKLEYLSITDSLTSLYNRRHFDKLFALTLSHAKRKEDTFIFFILDLDNFKRYNDNYGHKAGDDALIQIAYAMKSAFKRESDALFRIGGEEFAGILKVEDIELAKEHLQELVKKIEELHIDHQYNGDYKVLTISLGAVVINQNDSLHEDMLYQKADSALYSAKHQGRNRVVFV